MGNSDLSNSHLLNELYSNFTWTEEMTQAAMSLGQVAGGVAANNAGKDKSYQKGLRNACGMKLAPRNLFGQGKKKYQKCVSDYSEKFAKKENLKQPPPETVIKVIEKEKATESQDKTIMYVVIAVASVVTLFAGYKIITSIKKGKVAVA